MRVIYSFNKVGEEAAYWEKEIKGASDDRFTFVPFNHGVFLRPEEYLDAWNLDRLYRMRDPRLVKMYAAVLALMRETQAEALFVTNCPPYHPEFLLKVKAYRALFSTDDPDATYRRTIPYLHGYHHVFFCDPAYSPSADMKETMRSCGMVNADWLPIGVFDFELDAAASEDEVFGRERDIGVIYIGAFWRQKIDTIMRVRKEFRRDCRIYGRFLVRHNVYLKLRYGFPGWVREVSLGKRVKCYQRAKLGFNLHWGEYGLGNQRLYHLPGNGVMQISDCGSHLGRIFKVGEEVVTFETVPELVEQLRYYLTHEKERVEIARRGYERVMRDYRFGSITRGAGCLMQEGMERIKWGSEPPR